MYTQTHTQQARIRACRYWTALRNYVRIGTHKSQAPVSALVPGGDSAAPRDGGGGMRLCPCLIVQPSDGHRRMKFRMFWRADGMVGRGGSGRLGRVYEGVGGWLVAVW